MRFTQTFIGAFSSADIYRSVRLRAHYEMRYSFFLVTFSALLLVAYFIALAHGELFTARAGKPAAFDDAVRQIAKQLPVMTLQNNQLMTREARSHTINLSVNAFGKHVAGPFATIDTTGATTHENMKTFMLVTAQEVVFQSNKKTEIHSLSDYTKNIGNSVVINRAVADDMAANMIRTTHRYLVKAYLILGGVAWVALTLVLYLLRIAMVMVLGGAGMLIGKLLNTPVNYAAAVSLAAISYTPVAVADIILIIGFGKSASPELLMAGGLAMLTVALITSRDETA